MDIVAILILIAGLFPLVGMFVFLVDGDYFEAIECGVITALLIFLGLVIIYHRHNVLADIHEYTVTGVEMVSVEEKIYRITGIKDPGFFFTNQHGVEYTTTPPKIGSKVKDDMADTCRKEQP